MAADRDAPPLSEWIRALFADPELRRMGHAQRADDLDLGLGWIYYGLARLARPATAVVIGSWRGFVPLVIARALRDNGGGVVEFIDPSLADGFWKDADAVRRHLDRHGGCNVRHHRLTTQQFVETDAYRGLGEVGLLFVDGLHTAAQARFDHEAFASRLPAGALVLFHDSVGTRHSTFYGAERAYEVDVSAYMAELRREPGLELLDLPFGAGLTVLRRTAPPPVRTPGGE